MVADPYAHECERCSQLTRVGGDLRGVTRSVERLRAELTGLTKEYGRLHRGHMRCALCGVLVGPEHVEKELTPEPMKPRARGQRRYDVCSSCYLHLHKTRRSVPQQRAHEAEEEAQTDDGLLSDDDGMTLAR